MKLLGLGSESGNLSPYATSEGGRSDSVLDVEKGNTSEMEHSTSSQVSHITVSSCVYDITNGWDNY